MTTDEVEKNHLGRAQEYKKYKLYRDLSGC